MNLVFIYGPPASGKLTIAKKLSEATGIPLFHNHLSRNMVEAIYPNEVDSHYSLINKIRYDVIEYCAINGTDLIFTYVYEGSEDDAAVRCIIRKVESNGGKIHFVELTADKEDLMMRVDNPSRSKAKKLTNKKIMSDLIGDMTKFSIPFVEKIKINTTTMQPNESVSLLVDNLKMD